MNKKMCAGLLDGSLTHYKTYLAGNYKGYHITIDYKTSVYIVYIHATCDSESGKAQFDSFLKEHEGSTQYLSKAELKEHYVKLRIIDPKQKKIVTSVLNDTISPIITRLLGCKFVSGCIQCGDSKKELSCYEISGYHHYLCEDCIEKIEQDFKDKQVQLKEEKSNYALGTLGSFLGSLIGLVGWVVLFSNNLFAWIAGLVIIIFSYKGYETLGKRLDKKGFIISSCIIAVMIFLSNHVAWAWSILDAAKLEGYSISEILLLWKILNHTQGTVHYAMDLVIGYILSFVLGFKVIRSNYDSSVGNYSIKKCS